MTSNKETVQEYMHAYGRFDRPRVLACLTDDVEWIVPGAFHLTGKAAFESEMSNPAFAGQPEITVSRIVADDDIVVAEGSVRTQKATGEALHLVFCDVFECREGLVAKLTSYLMEVHG